MTHGHREVLLSKNQLAYKLAIAHIKLVFIRKDIAKAMMVLSSLPTIFGKKEMPYSAISLLSLLPIKCKLVLKSDIKLR